ncbi:polysaccharide lyase family 8 super-sandwich domain-containing protein [Labilibaculum sp.]|uniref:polysaccharide lyase family 8 super-sandwich domain-containing protein n=1 Tax=Labilibaculum sp. TaxID=2060723 RepID=UPI002AA91484|nr:polysaccharide lyase family 8 super-sandwich domain-containing protein [Labilibaculum sp.]
MNKIGPLSIFLFWCILQPLAGFSQSSEFEALSKIRKSLTGNNLSSQWEKINTEKALSLLEEDGRFSDAEPDKKQLTGRIMQWAIDYHRNSYENKDELRIAIYKSLQYWLDHRPKYSFPSIPFETLRAMAAIELVIYDDMMQDRQISIAKEKQIDHLIQSITEFSHWCWYNGKNQDVFDKADGHNRGGNVGYRLWGMTAIASCSRDEKEMDWVHQIVKEQFPRVLNTPTDFPTGFTPDGSWIQHNAGGVQNYWIGYGVHWITHILNYSKATNGTRWAVTNKEWNIIADYYLDGIQWYYFKNHGALNLAGRHNALKEPPLDNGKIRKDVLKLLELGNFTPRKEHELRLLSNRFQNKNFAHIDSTKYFWNTDLLIHSTAHSYFAIKMLSNRTTGCETSESERAHGKNNFLSGDGSTIIYSSGKEYDKARIGWNWRAWPGITALQKKGKLPLSPWGNESKSNNEFAGGLATAHQGIAAFQYNRKNEYVNLRANKAYFTYENKMLALGNAIRKNEADQFDVWTTINQTERKSDINFCINGKKGKIKAGQYKNLNIEKIKQISWIHHDNTAYIILPGKKAAGLTLFAEERTGNWADLDGRYQNKEENASIFQVSLSHGAKPNGADYSYIVIPNTKLETIKNIVKNELPDLIQNDEMAQAIKYGEDSYMIVLYQAGKIQLHDNLNLESDVPAILHLKKEMNQWLIRICDPLHKQEKAEIKIDENKKTKAFTIQFPKGTDTGKSIKTKLNF